MILDLDEDERELALFARETMDAMSSADALKAAYDEGRTGDDWGPLAESGLLGALVPEESGGLGLGALAFAIVLEEAGRVVLAPPVLETMLAAYAIAESADTTAQDEWLGPLASGQATGTVRLPGQRLVAAAQTADVVVVAREDRIELVRTADALVRPVRSFDLARPLALVADEDAPRTVLTEDPAVTDRLVAAAAAGAAAFLVGLSQRLLDQTLDYVRQRHQFGRAIGSFQVIKHRLADVHAAVQQTRPLTWLAAQSLQDADPQALLTSRAAKVQASATAALAGDAALQLHGGIGFAWEYELQYALKRGKALEVAYGTADEHLDAIAGQLL